DLSRGGRHLTKQRSPTRASPALNDRAAAAGQPVLAWLRTSRKRPGTSWGEVTNGGGAVVTPGRLSGCWRSAGAGALGAVGCGLTLFGVVEVEQARFWT
ncbi:MAG TPA: hypothetical protein VKY92_22215, partial [Verrucomicrobiae bacterium]|nr:hypothetical protein [Verrucomicrobiae bacterium]